MNAVEHIEECGGTTPPEDYQLILSKRKFGTWPFEMSDEIASAISF